MKAIVAIIALVILFNVVKNSKIDVGDDPISEYKVDEVTYKPCLFKISYSPGMAESKIYTSFKTKTLPLLGLESLSEESCECVEDALRYISNGTQQFDYAEKPYFIPTVKNNKFDIKIKVNDPNGVKELSFNKIAKDNDYNICEKWAY